MARPVRTGASTAVDDVPGLRRLLLEARGTDRYERAYEEPDPLVTVRIPTYVRVDTLMERAIPSILRQTHQNFEVIVVGDGCTNDTGDRIAALADPRVSFVNLPSRYPYPQDAHQRWLVAGTPGLNRGAELANGLWIATLYDDDEYEPGHIEQLLACARATRAEMVYAKLLQLAPDPAEVKELCEFPPGLGTFGMQAALFNAALRFFRFDINAWMLDEPGDWNVCRRMIEAGVRVEFLDRVVTRYYPSFFYGRDDPTP